VNGKWTLLVEGEQRNDDDATETGETRPEVIGVLVCDGATGERDVVQDVRRCAPVELNLAGHTIKGVRRSTNHESDQAGRSSGTVVPEQERRRRRRRRRKR
jgi:hypothetical protein